LKCERAAAAIPAWASAAVIAYDAPPKSRGTPQSMHMLEDGKSIDDLLGL
jgi:hypothetical protein